MEACTSCPYFSLKAQIFICLCRKKKSYSHRQKQAAIARKMRQIEKVGSKSKPTANEAKLGRHRQLSVTCRGFLDVCFYIFVYQCNQLTVNNRLQFIFFPVLTYMEQPPCYPSVKEEFYKLSLLFAGIQDLWAGFSSCKYYSTITFLLLLISVYMAMFGQGVKKFS